MTTDLPIDPSTISVGQEAKFVCPIEGCTHVFWRRWQPIDSSGAGFGVFRCFMHGDERPVLVIVAVRDVEEEGGS